MPTFEPLLTHSLNPLKTRMKSSIYPPTPSPTFKRSWHSTSKNSKATTTVATFKAAAGTANASRS